MDQKQQIKIFNKYNVSRDKKLEDVVNKFCKSVEVVNINSYFSTIGGDTIVVTYFE